METAAQKIKIDRDKNDLIKNAMFMGKIFINIFLQNDFAIKNKIFL